MFREQNLRLRSRDVFDLIQKHFLAFKTQNLLPQHVPRAAKLRKICESASASEI